LNRQPEHAQSVEAGVNDDAGQNALSQLKQSSQHNAEND
jgi:hypothetical protein